MRRHDGSDPLERFAVPEQDPRRGLGPLLEPVPVDDRALPEDLGVRAELPPQVLAQLHLVAEVRLRFDPRQLLAVEDDRLVKEGVRRLRVLPAQVLLRPVADPVLLEPVLEPLLALASPLPLQLHAVGRVDHVGGEQGLDLGAEPRVGGRLGVEEHVPDLLAGDAELPEHLLAHEDRRELPVVRDLEDRPPVLPRRDQPGQLAFDDVEAAGRIARDTVGVDDEEELLVAVLGVGDPVDVFVGDELVVQSLVGRVIHRGVPGITGGRAPVP